MSSARGKTRLAAAQQHTTMSNAQREREREREREAGAEEWEALPVYIFVSHSLVWFLWTLCMCVSSISCLYACVG